VLFRSINEHRSGHIISVEDPVEYLHRHKKSMIAQRELGSDTHSFGEALKRMLREDPDVVLVGEMRDLETIAMALTVAETGHLVLSTLHTSDAANAVARMIDVFPERQQQQIRTQISLVMHGVIVQQLLPLMNGTGRCVGLEIMTMTPAIRNLIREEKLEQVYSHLQMGASAGMVTMNASLAELHRQGKISLETALSKCTSEKELMRLLETSTVGSIG
jgi:twitching motility protein PilT